MSGGDYIREKDLYSRRVAQVIDQIGVTNAGTSTGSADAYVFDLESITGVRPPVRLIGKQRFYFTPNFTNAAANPTVQISSKIGAKVVKSSDGTTAIAAGAITSGYPIELEYDDVNDVLRLIYSSKPASSGGGGTGNAEEVDVDFGATESDLATATVSAAWVDATTKIICSPFAVATVDHDPEDYLIEDIQAQATNIQAGIGFDVIAVAPRGSFGVYRIHCIGV